MTAQTTTPKGRVRLCQGFHPHLGVPGYWVDAPGRKAKFAQDRRHAMNIYQQEVRKAGGK